ncbi:hypothetical protein ScPMuIL_012841 [Solemya velum]
MSALRQIPLTCSGHTRPVVHLAFSEITPFGYFLISACKDGKPMLRQGDTGDWIGTLEGHKGAVWGAALNRDATKAATGAADFSAKVWDAVSGEELQNFTHKHIVKSVDFSSDGAKLLTGSNEKLIRIFDLNQPEAEPNIFAGHSSHLKTAMFLQNDTQIVSASDDKTVRLWDVASGSEVKSIELPTSPTGIEIARNGRFLVITYGMTASVWDAERFEKIKDFEIETQLNSASLHPEEPIIVFGGEDFKLYKYDYTTGAELECHKGHFGPVHTVRFSPDGELYASGSEDGTLRLWQTNVGKTYGLWKCVEPEESLQNSDTGPPVVKAEA